jgi:transposase-like protein
VGVPFELQRSNTATRLGGRAAEKGTPVTTVAENRLEEEQGSPRAAAALQAMQTAACALVLAQAERGELPRGEALRAEIERVLLAGTEAALQQLCEAFGRELIGADRYARTAARKTQRAGTVAKRVRLPFGDALLRLVRPRVGSALPAWLAAIVAAPAKLDGLLRLLWVRGLSTRDVAAVSAEVFGREVSHTTVMEAVHDAQAEVLRWQNAPIADTIRYLALDALYVPIVRERSTKHAVLCALGITATGQKVLLDVTIAPSESLESWSTVLLRLLARGLKPESLRLVVTDGDAGLLAALGKHLRGVARQRCTVHKIRNVVGACAPREKATIPGECAAIYKAPNRADARARARAFIAEFAATHPKLAAIVEDDLEAQLAFYDLDPGLWVTLRSTNVLERVNKELRRKTRPCQASGLPRPRPAYGTRAARMSCWLCFLKGRRRRAC